MKKRLTYITCILLMALSLIGCRQEKVDNQETQETVSDMSPEQSSSKSPYVLKEEEGTAFVSENDIPDEKPDENAYDKMKLEQNIHNIEDIIKKD